ncbi:hypothetical protein P3342_005981 [Pyrenophora teres f. teres]|nr:hypothetical protein PTNB29_01590 [Pyrenophora teres f. teres]KAK1907653.1 hypothetical protein P3342_005981 [Pyrenophora teres f. teres]
MRSQRGIRRIKRGPATGEEKHDRKNRAKTTISVSRTPKVSKLGRQRDNTGRVESDTRAGASRSVPITLDSDDDESVRDHGPHIRASESQSTPSDPTRTPILDLNLERFRYQPQSSFHNQSGRRGRVHTPLSNRYNPTGIFLRRSASSTYSPAPDPTKQHRKYDTMRKKRPLYLNGADIPPKKMQTPTAARPGHFSPKISHVLASQQYDLDRTHPPRSSSWANSPAATGLSRTQQVNTSPKEEKRHDEEMTLLDIDEFDMRTRVAQLMAVAPAIPVRDLYHLIVDSKGRMSEAKQRAIMMSEVPGTHCQNKLSPRAQKPLGNDSDDGILVKIDYNDPAFDWDTDEPAPELIATTRARPLKPGSKKAATIHHASKNTMRMKSGTKDEARRTAKLTKPTFVNPTHARETSSDRDFVVADNIGHYGLISDDESELSDLSSCRSGYGKVKMRDDDDAFDLDIDMQPHYAYNADILRKKRGR